jgi:pSer/pThr/pTyr-binding forkhead associated (FHA) protein
VTDELFPGFEFEEGLYSPPVDAVRLGNGFPITIGRRSSNDLVLHHASVSGAHARLVREETEDGVVYATDSFEIPGPTTLL